MSYKKISSAKGEGGITLRWTGSNSTTPELTVTIDKGSIGDRYYKANFGTSRVITAKISRYCTRYNTGGYNDASCTMNIVPANSATLNGSLAFSGAQYQGGDEASKGTSSMDYRIDLPTVWQ